MVFFIHARARMCVLVEETSGRERMRRETKMEKESEKIRGSEKK